MMSGAFKLLQSLLLRIDIKKTHITMKLDYVLKIKNINLNSIGNPIKKV